MSESDTNPSNETPRMVIVQELPDNVLLQQYHAAHLCVLLSTLVRNIAVWVMVSFGVVLWIALIIRPDEIVTPQMLVVAIALVTICAGTIAAAALFYDTQEETCRSLLEFLKRKTD